jgi:hypothetical protein
MTILFAETTRWYLKPLRVMVNYNFKLNGATVQFGPDSIYSNSTLVNGDKVSVEVTNSFGCFATFNTITITVNTLPVVDTITGPTTVVMEVQLHLFL